MTVFFQIDDTLHQRLQAGELVLTPNRRLARHLGAAFQQRQTNSNGKTVWPMPRLFAIDDWLQERWLALRDRGNTAQATQLTPPQELALWQRLIETDTQASARLSPDDALARQAAASFRLLQRWQIPWQALPDDLPASAALKRWSKRFLQQASLLDACTTASAVAELHKAWQEGLLARETRITLCGFDDMPPLYRAVVDAAAATVTSHEPARAPAREQYQLACSSPPAEITAFAHWTRQLLMQSPDPHSLQIALVVPDLAARREEIERLLRDVLEPQHAAPQQDASAPPFNISAGMALADTPPVFAALSLLSLLQHEWPLNTLLSLLASPFWGDWIADLPARANAEKHWRVAQQFSLSQRQALALLARQVGNEALHSALQAATNMADTGKACLPSQWQTLFTACLHTLGWPGARWLNSLEHQQVEQWQDCLQQLASLDGVLKHCHLATALHWLGTICRNHVFQAKTSPAPIQVLGTLEAGGLHYTHLWLCGMSQQNWPATPAPDPLLPVALQRRHTMPHASHERELQYAQQLGTRFVHSTDVLVCSYAKHADDNEQTLSQLWRSLSPAPAALCELATRATALPTLANLPLQSIDTSRAPPVSNAETLRGGFSILKTMIANPFNAFAKFRLGVDTVPPPQSGLPATLRGEILHGALEQLWRRLQNSSQLQQTDSDKLQALLAAAISHAIAPLRQQYPQWQQALTLEQQRLQSLLTQWLGVEKTRAPFTVQALEQTAEVTLAGLPLTLRMDRIDQLASGELLLIDYKSGKANLRRSDWLCDTADEAPLEPQLPLYAAVYPGSAGISWAQINCDKTIFYSMGCDEQIPALRNKQRDWSRTRGEWQRQQQLWRAALENLAQTFMQGNAAVTAGGSPERAWQALNRVPEIELLWDEHDDNDGSGDDSV